MQECFKAGGRLINLTVSSPIKKGNSLQRIVVAPNAVGNHRNEFAISEECAELYSKPLPTSLSGCFLEFLRSSGLWKSDVACKRPLAKRFGLKIERVLDVCKVCDAQAMPAMHLGGSFVLTSA